MAVKTNEGVVLCKAIHHSDKKHSVRYDVFATTEDGKDVQIGAVYWPREHGVMPANILVKKS